MSDALTCIKGSDEKLSAFNNRLKAECDKFEPTRVQVVLIEGEPCVTLVSETVEAEQDDVDDAAEHEATIDDEVTKKPRPIRLGDEIPAGDIVCVKLVKIASYETPKMAAARKGTATQDMPRSAISEDHLEKVYIEANGLINDLQVVSGPPLAPEYVGQLLHYMVVVYVAMDPADDGQEAAEGEAALRG